MGPSGEHLPRDEGREHAHRAVGKVEDAGGAVDEHDAERGEGEDAAEAEADDRVGRECSHRATPSGADPTGCRVPTLPVAPRVREAAIGIVRTSTVRRAPAP